MKVFDVWNIIKIEGNHAQIDYLRREMLPEIRKHCTDSDLDLDQYLEMPMEVLRNRQDKFDDWCMQKWGFEDYRYASLDDFDILVILVVNGNAIRLIQKISELHPYLKFNMEFNIDADSDYRKEVVIQAGEVISSIEYSFKKYNSLLNRAIRNLKGTASYFLSKTKKPIS